MSWRPSEDWNPGKILRGVYEEHPDFDNFDLIEAGANAMLKGLIEQLDEWNSLVKHNTPNYPKQCGLLLTLEKWQELREEQT